MTADFDAVWTVGMVLAGGAWCVALLFAEPRHD